MASFDHVLGNGKRFGSSVGLSNRDNFSVAALSRAEKIPDTYWFNPEPISESNNISFDQIVQKPARLTIPGAGEAP